jgi:hypothetical protein
VEHEPLGPGLSTKRKNMAKIQTLDLAPTARIYRTAGFGLMCSCCAFSPTSNSVTLISNQSALRHAKMHRKAGHEVAETTIEFLWSEIREKKRKRAKTRAALRK